VPEEPLLSGALGAAILAEETWSKALAEGKTLKKAERRLKEARLFS